MDCQRARRLGSGHGGDDYRFTFWECPPGTHICFSFSFFLFSFNLCTHERVQLIKTRWEHTHKYCLFSSEPLVFGPYWKALSLIPKSLLCEFLLSTCKKSGFFLWKMHHVATPGGKETSHWGCVYLWCLLWGGSQRLIKIYMRISARCFARTCWLRERGSQSLTAYRGPTSSACLGEKIAKVLHQRSYVETSSLSLHARHGQAAATEGKAVCMLSICVRVRVCAWVLCYEDLWIMAEVSARR